jgi:hypothetical protein
MPHITKEQINDAIFAIDRGISDDDCDAAVFMLQGLLDQPEQEPFGFVREDYADARFNTGHIFKKKQGDYSIAVFTHPAPFTPITTDMVTDEMIEECYPEYFSKKDKAFKDMARLAIEPAYNAVCKYLGAKK